MFFPKFVYITKNTCTLFSILHVFAPLKDVHAYSAWSWKTTLITWIFGRAWYPPWHSSGPPGKSAQHDLFWIDIFTFMFMFLFMWVIRKLINVSMNTTFYLIEIFVQNCWFMHLWKSLLQNGINIVSIVNVLRQFNVSVRIITINRTYWVPYDVHSLKRKELDKSLKNYRQNIIKTRAYT